MARGNEAAKKPAARQAASRKPAVRPAEASLTDRALVVLVPIIVLVSIDPPLVLFTVFLLYGLSGPVLTLLQLRNRRLARKAQPGSEKVEHKNFR